MSQKIALVGGGTGGHIMPILSLVAHLISEERISGDQFFWIGGANSMEQEKAQESNIRFIPITTFKLTSTKSLGVFLYPFKLLEGIFEARKILKQEQPKLVFSKGGPGSVAVGIASWTLKIPLYIHESDTVPGFSNKILGHFATQIFLGFEEARKWFPGEKTRVVGQILHPRFFEGHPAGSIDWKTDKKHIFVSCGSQGSRKIFRTLLEQRKSQSSQPTTHISVNPPHPNLLLEGEGTKMDNHPSPSRRRVGDEVEKGEMYPRTINTTNLPDAEWIISLGTLNNNMRAEFEQWQDTQVFDWISQSDIPHILDGADVAITRASATTLAELATRPIHLIIIPLAISAGNHQLYNAEIYKRDGHIVILEKDMADCHLGETLTGNSPPHRTSFSSEFKALLEIFTS